MLMDCLFSLNQTSAGRLAVYGHFLNIAFVQEVGMHAYMCLPPRLLITSSVIWCNICMDPYDWFKRVLQCYVAAVVGTYHQLAWPYRIEECHRNQPNKTKLAV